MKYTYSNGDVAEGTPEEIRALLGKGSEQRQTTQAKKSEKQEEPKKKRKYARRVVKKSYKKALGNRFWSSEDIIMLHTFLNDKSNYSSNKLGKNGLAIKRKNIVSLSQRLGRSVPAVKGRLNFLRREMNIGY